MLAKEFNFKNLIGVDYSENSIKFVKSIVEKESLDDIIQLKVCQIHVK